MAFLPFALAFGLLAEHAGVQVAGWLIVGVVGALSISLAKLLPQRRAHVAPSPAVPCPCFRLARAGLDDAYDVSS